MRNAVAALSILLALLASAQVTPPTHLGRITGILLYPNGTPVPKGKVILTGATRPGENPTEVSTEPIKTVDLNSDI